MYFNTTFFAKLQEVFQSYEDAGGKYYSEEEDEEEGEGDDSSSDDCDNVF